MKKIIACFIILLSIFALSACEGSNWHMLFGFGIEDSDDDTSLDTDTDKDSEKPDNDSSDSNDGTDNDDANTDSEHEDITLTSIRDALNIGNALSNGTSTSEYYYIKGNISNIVNSSTGEMYLDDGYGNKILLDGLYDKTGETPFGDMTGRPAVGDSITVYAPIKNYDSTVALAAPKIITQAEGMADNKIMYSKPFVSIETDIKVSKQISLPNRVQETGALLYWSIADDPYNNVRLEDNELIITLSQNESTVRLTVKLTYNTSYDFMSFELSLAALKNGISVTYTAEEIGEAVVSEGGFISADETVSIIASQGTHTDSIPVYVTQIRIYGVSDMSNTVLIELNGGYVLKSVVITVSASVYNGGNFVINADENGVTDTNFTKTVSAETITVIQNEGGTCSYIELTGFTKQLRIISIEIIGEVGTQGA